MLNTLLYFPEIEDMNEHPNNLMDYHKLSGALDAHESDLLSVPLMHKKVANT